MLHTYQYSLKSLLIISCVLSLVACQHEEKIDVDATVEIALGQLSKTLSKVSDPTKTPRSFTKETGLRTVGIYDWTSGFFSGSLWYAYELTKDKKWEKEAYKWTEALSPIQHWSGNHDVGFMINCSYGNALRLTNKRGYDSVLVNTAESLSKRYSPITKSIESWDYRMAWDRKTRWDFPVIIDNMMNLELLFEATRMSGNKKFKKIAIQHALTTMEQHYRDDYSSYHVVDYDTLTGEVKDKATCQGFTDESSWARGQAWGLYGFIVCYRYTLDKRYLDFAKNIANYILNHPNMPEDLVPYWDYNVVDEGLKPEWKYDASKYSVIPRDVSAAAITCSALFELAKYARDGTGYRAKATKILNSLCSSDYFTQPGDENCFILNHSVGSIPHGAEIDVPLVYADYYFLESLLRYKRTIL